MPRLIAIASALVMSGPALGQAIFQGLCDLPGGGFRSHAFAVSAGGLVVVGQSRSENGTEEAFRWTASEGMVGLGDLPGGAFVSSARAVSPDGTVIVGYQVN